MSLILRVWNVQHGSAAVIVLPNGQRIVHDLGAGFTLHPDIDFSPLQDMYSKNELREIDALIITHADQDHIADILSLGQLGIRVKALHRPKGLDIAGRLSDASLTHIQRQRLDCYKSLDAQFSVPLPPEVSPFNAALNGGVEFAFFRPDGVAPDDFNNNSIVTVVKYAGGKFLLTGDTETGAWRKLLENPKFVESIAGAGVLLAPHHGRESGYCAELLEHFKPQLTIVSDSRDVDTSASARYSAMTSGFVVKGPDGATGQRKVVSTRRDGHIDVRVTPELAGGGVMTVKLSGLFG